MKKFIMSVVSVLLAGTAFCAVTTHLSLDCREGAKVADTAHPLVYDATWYAGGVTAKITVDGQEIVSGTAGAYSWTPSADDVNLLTLNVYNDSDEVVGKESVYCLSREDLADLVIPEGTTEIGAYAFLNGQFTSVTIPNSVTNIGANAFAGCVSLSRVNVPSMADWVGMRFENGEANPLHTGASLYVGGEEVTELVIPEGTAEIGEYAFAGGQFTSVTIPNSVTNVALTAFAGCSNIVEVACGRLSDAGGIQKQQAEILLEFDGDFVNAGARGGELVNNAGQFVSDRFGRDGRACYFNGQGQNAYFAEWDSVRVEDTFTIAFWFKTDVSVSNHGSSSTAWNPGNYAFFPANSGDASGFGIKVGTDGIQVCEHGSFYLPTVLNYAGNIGSDWNHVAVAVENSGAIRLYLNGELVSTGNGSTRKRYAVPAGVGGGEWGYYTGAVDDVAVFDHAMTDSELQAMNAVVAEQTTLATLFPDSYVTIGSVEIGEGTTALASHFFDGCESLTSVTLPSTLTDCGDNDLRWLAELSGVEGLVINGGCVIGYNGDAPNVLTIPDGVKGIAPWALSEQYDLEEVVLPSTLKTIGVGAFAGDTVLGAVEIPDGVEKIDTQAFKGCSWLTDVVWGSGLKEIGAEAFSGCPRIAAVELPGTITTIGANAFAGLTSLKTATVPTHVMPLRSLLPGSASAIEEIVISDGSPEVCEEMFKDLTALKTVAFAASVTNVGARAFYGCSSLESIEFVGAVGAIGDSAFRNCSRLGQVDFGTALRQIDVHAFNGCSALGHAELPGTVETIGDSAFSGCSSLTYVSLGPKATSIGSSAFNGCRQLGWLTFPEGTTIVGDSVLYGCSALKSVGLPESVSDIRSSALRSTALTEVVLPAAVTNLGAYVFGNGGFGRICYLGNAPAYNLNVYSGTASGLVSCLCEKSYGWDGNPQSRAPVETWPTSNARAVEYTAQDLNRFAVTFNANGGSFDNGDGTTSDSRQVTETQGFRYVFPSDVPRRDGFAFTGWTTDAFGGIGVAAGDAVSASAAHALYAHWSPQFYIVSFDGNGGTGTMPDESFGLGESKSLTANAFERTGYRFAGWSRTTADVAECADGETVSRQTLEQAGTTVLRAVWTPNAYTVCFDANGGKGTMADQAFQYDEEQALCANVFTRAGYAFAGWNVSAPRSEDAAGTVEDGAVVSNLTATADGVVNLYAVWDGVATTWMEDDSFSAVVANTYDGYMIDGNYNLLGIVQVKTTKQSVKKGVVTITATATVTDANGKKWSYKKGVVTVAGVVTGLKCTTKGCPVGEFGVKVGKNGMEGVWGEYAIFGARNGMGTKGDAMKTALEEAYKGKWSVTLSAPVAETATVRLQLNVQAKGVVKIAGNWENGAKVSASAQMIMGDGFAYVPVMVKSTKTSPALNALLRIDANGEVVLLGESELVAGGRTVEALGEPDYLPSEVSAGGKAFSARVAVDELAYPAKFAAKKLPTGLKIDAATGVISGTPTKPGHYVAEVTVTSGLNSKVKKTLTVEFDIANYTDDLIPIEDSYGPYYVGVSAVEQIAAAAGCTVSGLPSGLKWTAKDIVDTKTKAVKTAANTVYGVPTKADTGTVYFKKSVKEMVNGKQKSVTHQASATFVVEGMQPWAIGTFDGGSSNGIVALTVAKTGKLSGKWMSEGLTWALSAASFDAYYPEEEKYVAMVQAKCGKETKTIEVEVTQEGVTGLSAPVAEDRDGTVFFEAWRNGWKEEPLKTLAKDLKGKTVSAAAPRSEDAAGAVLLTVGASGAVTAKGTFVTGFDETKQKDLTYSASCSTVLIPTAEVGLYRVYLYFPPKAGKFAGWSGEVGLRWDGTALVSE